MIRLSEIFNAIYNHLNNNFYRKELKSIMYKDFASYYFFLKNLFNNEIYGSVRNIRNDNKTNFNKVVHNDDGLTCLGVGLTNAFEHVAIKNVISKSVNICELHIVEKMHANIIEQRYCDLVIESEFEALNGDGIYDMIIFRHFPFNKNNSSMILKKTKELLKVDGIVIVSFYYKHELESFLMVVNKLNNEVPIFNVIKYGLNEHALELNGHQRKICENSPIIINKIEDEKDIEISKRDKWYALIIKNY